ncbi:MAG TPA: class I SAM-dependent methyltransferase [Caulobacteraceae bacterium]|nr:class I SAM-dependent methyltransferase [Caulobacteraceae bacterium]
MTIEEAQVAAVAASFNAAADRTDSLLAAHKSLLANASLELRSPLSRLAVAAEILASHAEPGSAASVRREIAELHAPADEILPVGRLAPGGEQAAQASKAALSAYVDGGFNEVMGWGIDSFLGNVFTQINDFQVSRAINGPLVEIGVQDGRVLILLGLMAQPGEAAIGIDIFDRQEENLDHSGINVTINKVMKNLRKFAPAVNFDLINSNSFRLLPYQQEKLRHFRFLHIDGGHYLEVVLNDLELGQRMIGAGGVIVVDDYWHSGFPEVQEAVHRYFDTSTNIKAAPFMVGSNKLFLASHEIRDSLRDYMAARLPENRRKSVRVMGYDAITCDPQW